MRRKRRRYQSRHQLLYLDQSQRRNSKRHLQNVNAQTITPQIVRLLISVIFSAQPMGYHMVTTWVSTRH
ncbi:hypothetical protein DPMN_002587 [Dreissena polymorpha]|uniref:Uncharacterized protein n=1 Tax=Dreissena polymorpha TaxID=45954 RepID=A0A9D4MML5_DREPO|nr:hypothetical protein DPMN_002587 [Dreissena polymorpha]